MRLRRILIPEALKEIRKRRIQTNLKTKALKKIKIYLAHNLKPVKRNPHPQTLTSSEPSMNSIVSLDPDPASKIPARAFGHDTRTLIEEIATAIAEAQAALFTGRIQDLETSI
jgi:hypothetical protein